MQFAKENPHVALYLKPRRHRSPVIVAEYRKSIEYMYILRDQKAEKYYECNDMKSIIFL